MNKDSLDNIQKTVGVDLEKLYNFGYKFLLFCLIVYISVLIARGVYKLVRRGLKRALHDNLVADFLANTAKIIVILIGIVIALQSVGFSNIADKIFTAGAASAVIVGFALKDIGENFVSGIILSFNRPFNVNDAIQIENIFGKVQSMGFRTVKLKTYDGKDVYIPNSDIIKKAVYNYSEDGFYRMDIELTISIDNDLDYAEKLLLETINKAEGVTQNDQHQTLIMIDSMTSGAVTFKGLFWISTSEYREHPMRVKSNVLKELKSIFAESKFKLVSGVQVVKIEGYNPLKEEAKS